MSTKSSNERSHDRSPDKEGFSIALPKELIREISLIAAKEERSRNKQIELLLRLALAMYKTENKPSTTLIELEAERQAASSARKRQH